MNKTQGDKIQAHGVTITLGAFYSDADSTTGYVTYIGGHGETIVHYVTSDGIERAATEWDLAIALKGGWVVEVTREIFWASR